MVVSGASDRAATRRQEALVLAEELLGDIELQRIAALDVARKASRLARLLDDQDAMNWLSYEVGGYPQALDPSASLAAIRSRRGADEGKVWTQSLGELEVAVRTMAGEIEGLTGPGPAGDSAYRVYLDQHKERNDLRQGLAQRKAILDRVVGALHSYAAERYQELRFGTAVETAFEVVRAEVDGTIAELVPEALPMLGAAFENATSDKAEHWANAASTCRRLLKQVADVLRPPGPDKELPGGKKVRMGDANYINRLVDWITSNSPSVTSADMITADLEYLGRRLDAADDAGHKGAHSRVDRFDASRFIAGTYLLLGDVLRLRTPSGVTPTATTGDAVRAESEVAPDVAPPA